MPWYMDPSTACVDCQLCEGTGGDLERFHLGHQWVVGKSLFQAWFLLMNRIFLFLAKELGLGTLSDLLGFTLAHELFAMSFRFSENEILFFREFERRSCLEPLTFDGFKEVPPTRLIVVSNFAIITRLLARLSSNAQVVFKSVHQYVHLDGSLSPDGHPKMKAGIIDSHFHLDGFSIQYPTTLPELESSMKTPIPVNLRYGIQNFVFPTRWFKIGRQMAGEPRLRFTLGIHPHVLDKNKPEMEFRKLERKLEEHPEAVGIGETGIDHTTRCKCSAFHNKDRCREEKIETQCQFLRLALQLAKRLGKVIILHVRSHDKDKNAQTAKDTLKILLDLDLHEAPIHRHCFIGGLEEYNDGAPVSLIASLAFPASHCQIVKLKLV